MAWRAAQSLLVLQRQCKPHAPKAPAVTWGLVADAAHSSTSDHAPHDFPGWGNDIVTAADIPDGYGLNAWMVLDSIRRSKDPRAKYGISRGWIFSNRQVGSVPAWTWRRYTGTDGHWTHGHLSVVGDKRADQTHPWQIGLGATSANTPEGDDDLMDHWQDPTVRTAAQRIGAVHSMAPTVTVNYGTGNVAETNELAATLRRIEAATVAETARDQALMAAVTALATVGGADHAPIVNAINSVHADTMAAVTELQESLDAALAKVAELETELEQRRHADRAAAQAQATALTD